MDPITALSLAKTAAEISNRLYELGKRVKDRETKQQINELLDSVSELKHSATQLEDENRDLREKLRFKSDEYKFHNPFWYHKADPNQPLCPTCFAKSIAAPMSAVGQGCLSDHRRCLVCFSTMSVSNIRREFYAS
jgi:hypothetical protein